MGPCRASKAGGTACKAPATGSHGYCWAHDPEHAEQRRRAASKAARSKPNREVKGYKREVRALITEVKNGGQDRADAAVILQGYRVLKDLVELERRVKETDDFATRLEELERAHEGGKRWAT